MVESKAEVKTGGVIRIKIGAVDQNDTLTTVNGNIDISISVVIFI